MPVCHELEYKLRDFPLGIAIMEIEEWSDSGSSYKKFLSTREQNRLSKFNHKKRKLEWLASRLVAKYLFLSQLELNNGRFSKCPWSLTFRQLRPIDLSDFSLLRYQKIEILPERNREGGAPRLIWCDDDYSNLIQISISHAGGWAGAFISSAGWIGMDLEEVAPRGGSFYRRCFSEMERDWVNHGVKENSIGVDWLYTLLWTLKECYLKSGQLEKANIWNVNKVEVKILTPISDIVIMNKRQLSTDGLMRLDAQLKGVSPGFTIHIAYMSIGKVILSVINSTK